MKPFIQRLRSLGINLACVGMNFAADHIVLTWDGPATLRDHFGWWLEDRFSELFAIAYNGSDEELAAVDDDEIPPAYMSQRQLEYFESFDLSNHVAHCVYCHWEGEIDEAFDYECPKCPKPIFLRPRGCTPAHKPQSQLLLMERSLA